MESLSISVRFSCFIVGNVARINMYAIHNANRAHAVVKPMNKMSEREVPKRVGGFPYIGKLRVITPIKPIGIQVHTNAAALASVAAIPMPIEPNRNSCGSIGAGSSRPESCCIRSRCVHIQERTTTKHIVAMPMIPNGRTKKLTAVANAKSVPTDIQ